MNKLTKGYHFLFMLLTFIAMTIAYSSFKAKFFTDQLRGITEDLQEKTQDLSSYKNFKIVPLKDLSELKTQVATLEVKSKSTAAKKQKSLILKPWLSLDALHERNQLLKKIYKLSYKHQLGIVSQFRKVAQNVKGGEGNGPTPHHFKLIGNYLNFFHFFKDVDALPWQTQVDELEFKTQEESSLLEINFILKI